ncbi:MAG TPA: FAD-dependent thymidylate synthase [Candidatus Avidehalobacter gallistercoris]|uniref:Flavin-dependent thymidylate synthase n=1 Tax=Candidatus Avidehalobacter gallistercoris TaxID=2840694 RepID=A0A9D1KZS2_9FIRM|nr:FAD-dependent thymidylate synthase [Candidatus Avidehalobacter gallistercoris]
MLKVTLLDYTPEPEKLVAAAARLCYSSQGADELMDSFTPEKVQSFVQKLVSLGHESPMEHVSFTFAVSGISRACSHQLVRHRVGVSFSQKSQRYVKEKQFEYVTPPKVAANPELKAKFDKAMAGAQAVYEELLTAGVPAEDARFVLPNAASTSLVVTMNVRSLWHFFQLRCCNRAQWEIRTLANAMLAEVREVAPLLFAKAGATCDSLGVCFEGAMSCGKCKNVLSR